MRLQNFKNNGRGVLLLLIIVRQVLPVLAVGAGGVFMDAFSLVNHFLFFLPLSLWETARYIMKYCPKGSLNPKQTINQIESNVSLVTLQALGFKNKSKMIQLYDIKSTLI